MNREIKLKVLHNNKVIGLEKLTDDGWQWMCYELNPDNGERWNYGVFPKSDEYKRVLYTGLKDKNGVEIYEGDIVKTSTDKPMVIGWSVKFASFVIDREDWMFSHWFGESCNPEDLEVIGNTYENSELIPQPK